MSQHARSKRLRISCGADLTVVIDGNQSGDCGANSETQRPMRKRTGHPSGFGAQGIKISKEVRVINRKSGQTLGVQNELLHQGQELLR